MNNQVFKKIVAATGLFVCLFLGAFQLYWGFNSHPIQTAVFTAIAVGLSLLFLKNRQAGLLGLIAVILLSGWATTWVSAPDLDLRPLLVVALVITEILKPSEKDGINRYLGFYSPLLLLSVLTLISLTSSILYVFSFRPIPGWDYINLAINPFSASSGNFIFSSLNVAGVYAMWWGVFFLGLKQKWDAEFKRKFVILFFILISINLLVAIFQLNGFTSLSGTILEDGRVRPHGLLQSAHALNNVAAIFFAFILVVRNENKNKRLLIPLAGLAIVAVFIGGGFTALVYSLFTLLAIGLLLLFKSRVEQGNRLITATNLIYTAVILVLIGLSIWLIQGSEAGSDIVERISRISNVTGEDFALQGFIRQSSWRIGMDLISQFPFGGIGIGTFPVTSINASALKSAPHFLVDNSLNYFIEIAVSLGVLSLFLVLFLFGKIMISVLKTKTEKNPAGKIALILPLFTFCFFGFSGPHLNDMESAMVFWLMMSGLVVSRCSREGEMQYPKTCLVTASAFIIVSIAGAWLFHDQMSLNQVNQKLRWHLGVGNHAREDNGEFWTSRQAIISFIPDKHYLHLRWRTSAEGSYQPEVKMMINGKEVMSKVCKDNLWVDSYFFLGKIETGYSYLSLEVSDVFVPALHSNSDDKRPLGVKIGKMELINRLPENFSGFWGWELAKDERYQWSKAQAFLNIPQGAESLSFSLRAARPDVREHNVTVTFSLFGKTIRKVTLDRSGWHRVDLNLADHIKESHLSDVTKYLMRGRGILEINVDSTWNPGQAGKKDTRELGVAFKPHWLQGN